MPKEPTPMPLGRSQARSGHQQQVYGQSHQQPSSYHHLQQYHHLPRPPGYEYYAATAAYQAESQTAAQAPSGTLRDVPAAYEHALKMNAKYERSTYAAPQAATAFKIASHYDHRPPSTQAPQTSVQHKTSYDRTSHSSSASYNRGSQSLAAVQYEHKMSAYPPALPYDRFSKKKLATHAPDKTPVGGSYGSSRSDKKSSVYDRPVVPSSSYDRLTSKVTVSSPMEVDKVAQNLSYERHKAYRASEYERRERHRRVAEVNERSDVQYERQYETTSVSSAYERLGAAPPPVHTIASSYERQPPTSSYERHSSVSAAYERRAVFDRAYEVAAYERRLFPSTSAFSSINHAYYTGTTNVSPSAVYASSTVACDASMNMHDPSTHAYSLPLPENAAFSPVFSLSSNDSTFGDIHNDINILSANLNTPVASMILHDPIACNSKQVSLSSATYPVYTRLLPSSSSSLDSRQVEYPLNSLDSVTTSLNSPNLNTSFTSNILQDPSRNPRNFNHLPKRVAYSSSSLDSPTTTIYAPSPDSPIASVGLLNPSRNPRNANQVSRLVEYSSSSLDSLTTTVTAPNRDSPIASVGLLDPSRNPRYFNQISRLVEYSSNSMDYETQLFSSASAVSSIYPAYYTATNNVSPSAIYASSTVACDASKNMHDPSTHAYSLTLPENVAFSPVFTLSSNDSTFGDIHNDINIVSANLNSPVARVILHDACHPNLTYQATPSFPTLFAHSCSTDAPPKTNTPETSLNSSRIVHDPIACNSKQFSLSSATYPVYSRLLPSSSSSSDSSQMATVLHEPLRNSRNNQICGSLAIPLKSRQVDPLSSMDPSTTTISPILDPPIATAVSHNARKQQPPCVSNQISPSSTSPLKSGLDTTATGDFPLFNDVIGQSVTLNTSSVVPSVGSPNDASSSVDFFDNLQSCSDENSRVPLKSTDFVSTKSISRTSNQFLGGQLFVSSRLASTPERAASGDEFRQVALSNSSVSTIPPQSRQMFHIYSPAFESASRIDGNVSGCESGVTANTRRSTLLGAISNVSNAVTQMTHSSGDSGSSKGNLVAPGQLFVSSRLASTPKRATSGNEFRQVALSNSSVSTIPPQSRQMFHVYSPPFELASRIDGNVSSGSTKSCELGVTRRFALHGAISNVANADAQKSHSSGDSGPSRDNLVAPEWIPIVTPCSKFFDELIGLASNLNSPTQSAISPITSTIPRSNLNSSPKSHSSPTPNGKFAHIRASSTLSSPAPFSPHPAIKLLTPDSPESTPGPESTCTSSAWQYPYPSYDPYGSTSYSRGQERQPPADEFEAKDVPTSSIYPAKPRMSLLTSPEYLSSMRRSQLGEDNARSGQASVIVPPSRSPADGSAPPKRLREAKSEPTAPLTIDTSACSPKPDPEKPSIYMPTVEPISPTSPPEAVGDDGADASTGAAPKSSAKDNLLLDIARVDREINKIEHHIFNLKRKQVELEQKAKSSKTEPSDEAVEAPLPQHFSLSHKIYSENRRKAKEAHGALSHLGPPVDLPLYNQPTDMPVYQENRRRHQLFKGRLIAHLRRKRREKCSSEVKMMEDYARQTDTWNRLVEKMETSPERKRRDAENRELFEKTFPKIRKEREDRERFLRVGSRVKSDADLEEIMDNLHEQEMEVKKMRDYAAVPPMLLSVDARRCVYVNTNGLIEDFSSEHKDRRLVNVWTDSEKEIFKEKYLAYPKNFGAISAFLERKSVSDCVQYYYLSKKTENYKLLLKKSGQKSRSGRNKNKTAAPPPMEPAQLATPPAPSIAPRFQRDYKPEGSTEAAPPPPLEPPPAPSATPPPAPPSEPEISKEPVVINETPPQELPELPPPPDLSTTKPAPVAPTPPLAPKPTTVALPRLAPVVTTPPTLKPLMLPFPDIPIVVIDDSDDSNSSSHFPYIRK